MKKICLFIFAVFISVGLAVPAQADLDQLCLKQCVSTSGNSSSCMTQCTYGPVAAVKPPAPQGNVFSPHRILDTPMPDNGQLLLPARKVAPLQPDTDYTCLNQCLHGGRPYEQCKEGCIKPVCDPGAVLCATSAALPAGSTSGAVPSSSLPGVVSSHP